MFEVLVLFVFIFTYLVVLSLSCSMWDLVPQPGIKHGPSGLGLSNLSHWTTREILILSIYYLCF